MKKIISLFLIALFTITLAGCDLFGEDTEIPEEILDCILNPDAEGCEIDPTDIKSAKEILADAIIDNWDGDITHLNTLMDLMDFSESMEITTEFNFDVIDEDNEAFLINVVMTDSFLFLATGDVLERHLAMNIEGDLIEVTFIFEEIDTGVSIYVEVSDLVDEWEVEEPEITDVMTVLGIDQDWLKFTFDDTLANMVEIEVMKEILFDIIFKEQGANVFIDLQAEILSEIGVDLDDYTLDLDALMTLLEIGDYAGFRAGVAAINFDGLLLALDAEIVAPEIEDFLTEFTAEFTAEGWDVPAEILLIQADGTEAWLGTLTDEEMATFLNMIPEADWRLVEQTVDALRNDIPWQAVSDITLPTTDPDTGATIVWSSNNTSVISNTGVVVQPGTDEWYVWVELQATVTFGDETRHEYFQVYVPPTNAVDFHDEYNDYDYDEHDDPVGDYLKDTVDVYEIIQFVKELKDVLVDLDYTAIELEEVDIELLIDAIYENQAAFDLFVVGLATTAPEHADLLEVFSPVIGYAEEHLFLVDVKYALDNLTMFEDYLTFAYYVDNNYVDLSIGHSATFEIVTTATLEPNAFGTLFVDVVGTASNYLDGFTDLEIPYLEHLHCPVGETCEDWDDYDRIVARLNEVSYLDVVTTYDPGIPGEIETVVDFTGFLDAVLNMTLYDDELLDRAVDKLERQMPWQVITVIDLPTADVDNNATIVWTSNDPGLITAAGVVTVPGTDEWDRWVELVAVVTVGTETETLYFQVHVPPVNATDVGDEYDNDWQDVGNGIFDLTSITDVSLTITVKDTATVILPTVTEDVNAIAEDFARFSLSILAYDYAEQIAEYYIDNPLVFASDVFAGTTKPLSYYVDFLYITSALDDDLSTVVIGGTATDPTLSIQLFWIDGTEVFDDPLTLAELASMFGEGEEGPDTNAIFQYYVDEVDETNFNMTKLLFVYIFNDGYDDDEEYYD